MIANNFLKTIDLLHLSMDANMIRRDVIADNLANSEVPNYKRTDLNFESQLKKALDSEKQKPVLDLRMSNLKHIPNWRPMDYRDVKPRRMLDFATTAKNNGNNVDPEQEIMAGLKNQLSYYLFTQAMTFQFNQISMVLR